MNRINLVTVVGVILIALIFAYSQEPQRTTSPSATQAEFSQSVKAKKILVNELPKGLEGIVLEKGIFKLRPGYKFVNQTRNTVAVALKAGGGLTGTFTCGCYAKAGSGKTPSGNCKVKTTDSQGSISCVSDESNPCNAECFLDAKVNKTASRLAIF
jgi:hypothetical protein